ncbi:MAG: methyl-accepting chemotaxis protein [Colwellia sp.]|nr:methyl-accepting chemotaxis protein [Colwellia sp.]
MNLLFSWAVSLSNTLRFKAKFSILAIIFFIPIIASTWWIVGEQWQRINQYDLELEGLDLVHQTALIEQTVKLHPSQAESKIAKLNKLVNHSSLAKELNSLSRAIVTKWLETDDKGADFQQLALIYEQSLSLRENTAAFSGLSRESKASAFYLAEMVVQRFPALVEYLGRIQSLAASILENDGFTSQSYTLLVALDQRLDELQMQLFKTNEQLRRVDEGQTKNYHQKINDFLAALDLYQQGLRDNVINPDEILWSLNAANQAAAPSYELSQQLLTQSHQMLVKQLTNSRELSLWYLILLGGVLTGAAVLTGFMLMVIYMSIKQSAIAINEASAKLESGDFTHELKVNSRDELGDIAANFNQMQEKIHQLLSLFNSDVVELKNSAGNINQLSNDMAKSLASQQENTHNVVSSIKQMSSSVTVISDNALSAREITELASSHVIQGQSVINETTLVINDIAKEVNESAVVINELAGYSSEIGQFVNVIRKIADQTNLLALNAAIEAARAGEQGRGFAVVADEVRTLASRTQESTAEIQRIIEQLQLGATKSVEAMNRGVVKADNGVEKTTLVAATFLEVTQNVEQIVDGSVQISSAVEQQSQMVSDIESHTDKIADGADNVMKAAIDAADAGENLAVLAENLSKQLGQFKL